MPKVISVTSRQANLQEDTCLRVMRLLEANPDLTQRKLAIALGVSLGGLNYCLKALIQKGYLKVGNFKRSKNKLGYVYLLTPAGVGEKARLTASFLRRKIQEHEAIKAEIEALTGESFLITLKEFSKDRSAKV